MPGAVPAPTTGPVTGPSLTGSSISQLVQGLGPGWKLVGSGVPIEDVTVTSYTDPTQPGAGPQSVNRGTGRYYVIVQDADNHQRALFLKAREGQPALGGQIIRQSGVNDQPDKTSGASPTNLFQGDLSQLQWDQAGPVGDVPAGDKTPSPSAALDRIGPNGKVIPPTDTTTKVVELRDPKTGAHIPLPQDPNGVVTPVGNNFYVIKPDGSSVLVTDKSGAPVTKSTEAQALNVPGIGLVAFDPNNPKNSTVIIPTPKGVTAASLGAQATQVRNGKTYVAVDGPDGVITWQETNLPAQHTYTLVQSANDPNSKWITLVDENGQPSYIEKKDWKPPPNAQAGTAITPDTTSPFIVTIGEDGKPVFTKNTNQLTINDAQRALIEQLGGQVAAGSMSEAAAEKLIKSMTEVMVAQATQQATAATAAGNVITSTTNAAQTGAGILQQRAATAQNLVQQGLGPLGQTKSGLLVAPAADFGQNLVMGAQGFATDLMGGPEVAQAAANLVRRADPTGSMGQDAAQAYAYLGELLQGYRKASGGAAHPIEQLATGGATTPTTQPQAEPDPYAGAQYTPYRQFPAQATSGATTPVTQPTGYVPSAFTGRAFTQSGLSEGRGGFTPLPTQVPQPPAVAPPPQPTLPQAATGATAPITQQPMAYQPRQITINVPV